MSEQRQSGTRYDRRAYHRFKTGMMYHWYEHKRFLTLTGVGKNYRKSFNALRRFLRKNWGTFEYFCVRTSEGKGVFHICFIGSYIEQKILSDYWKKLTGMWNVSISLVKNEIYQGYEMTRQKLVCSYSHSKGWYPPKLKFYWQKIFKRLTPLFDAWNHFVLCFPESEFWVAVRD